MMNRKLGNVLLAAALICGLTAVSPARAAEEEGRVFPEVEVYEATNAWLVGPDSLFQPEGDVQIPCSAVVKAVMDDDGTVHYLADFLLENYQADGSDLVMISAASNPMLLTLAPQEDGTYQVTEAVQTEDGGGYYDSLVAMCEAIDAPVENVDQAHSDLELQFITECRTYLAEHPEIERIEVDGALLTVEDLDARIDQIWEEFLEALNGGDEFSEEELLEMEEFPEEAAE